MSGVWQENIVRLCSSGGGEEALGTGTLVATRQDGLCVLTCAHVLNAALGRGEYAPERPDDDAVFVFDLPARSRGRKYRAKLLEWWPPLFPVQRIAQPVGDIALLKIVSADIPQSVRPWSVDDFIVDELQDRLVRSFGFARPGGEFAAGRLLGEDVSGWMHFAAESAQGPFVAPGFSGAPLFDDERRFILGMVAAVDEDEDKRVAYALATQLIWTACPQLARPYRGLRDFGERDRAFFFGRKVFVGRLCEKLKSHPIVGVAGASGSGKSSVVKAGLIPELRKERDWTILKMRPAADPWAELARELIPLLHEGLSLGDRLGKEEELTQKLRADPSHLGDCLRGIARAKRSGLVLVFVDQFEELFTQAGHEAGEADQTAGVEKPPDFRDLMLRTASLKGSPSIQWLYTLRADFAGQAYRHPAFVEALGDGEEKLADMNATELRQSIVEPARKLEVDFEAGRDGGPSVSERIADAVEARPGSLPLMAHLLEKLWEKLERRQVTHDAYDGLGGLEGALNRHADEVYEALTAERKLLARRLFSRLVKIEEGNEPTRRVRTRDELGEELWQVAGLLADADSRLLVIRGTGEAMQEAAEFEDTAAQARRQTTEVAHEALLRNWGRFRGWLKEDLAFLLWRQRLEQRMDEYQRYGRSANQLLREEALAEANGWSGAPSGEDLTSSQKDYIELSNKKAEEEAKQRASAAKERIALLTSQRRWIAAALILAIAIIAGGGLAYSSLGILQAETEGQRIIAEANLVTANTQKQIAIGNETRALAALSAIALADHHPIDALKLALAAWPRSAKDIRPPLEATLIAVSNVLTQGRLPVLQLKHNGPVSGALFSKDETRILSWSRDNTLRLWDAATAQQIGPPMRHDGPVREAVFSNDGTRILSWSGTSNSLAGEVEGDNTVRLWEAATGRQIGLPMRHDSPIPGALFSADETRILSWSDDRTLRLWDAATAQQVGPHMHHDGPVKGALFSKDEALILSWSEDNTLRLWDAASAQQIGLPMRHDSPVREAVFSKDGTRILSWSEDSGSGQENTPTLRLWDAATAQPIGDPMPHDDRIGGIYGALFTKDDTIILSWSYSTLRLWQAATAEQITPPMHQDGPIQRALFTNNENRILSWSNTGTLRLWDAATGRPIGRPMRHEGAVIGALFSKDETSILSWSYDNTLRLWDASTGEQMVPPMKHNGWVYEALFSKDESRILSWSGDNTLRLWDTATGQPIDPPMRHNGAVSGALFSKNESRILSWSIDGILCLWDAATAQPVGPPMKHEGGVSGALFFGEHDTRILSRSYDVLHLWDAATGQPIGPLMRYRGPVSGALLSKDDSRILSWSEDKTLRLWDAATGQSLSPLMKHDGSVSGALFSKDDTRIVSWSSEDKTLRLWDAATAQPIAASMKHNGSVNGALFSNDETRILSWSEDKTLRLWDTATTQPIAAPMKHNGSVNGALFSNDDARILSWSEDKTVRLWDAARAQPIGHPMRHDGPVRAASLSEDETRILSWTVDVLHLWDAATGEPIGPPMKHEVAVSGATFSSDSTRILSASYDNTVRLLDAATAQLIRPPMAGTDAMFSTGGSRILSWTEDVLHLWDAATGEQIGPPMKHEGRVSGALFTGDETRILSWSAGNERREDTLRLWDAATGQQIVPSMHHDYPVNGAMFSKDNTRIVSWSNDNTVHLWDTATGQPIGPPLRHGENVHGALFNKDETRILSWSRDGNTLHLWNTEWPRGNLLEIACDLLPDRELTGVSQRHGVSIAEPICGPNGPPAPPDWSKIERAPVQQ
ncbi:trypsin-like peptidase domain-containing protein (plasmid) [Sinorhizobium meliloti]